MNHTLSKIVICVALLAIALVCFFPLAETFSEPDRYLKLMDSIDGNTETVLKLMAASTMTSAGLSAIPGDTATPIAEKLADFSEYFLLILCVLYAEKYLLTIIPLGVFRGVIPLACAVLALGQFWNGQLLGRKGWKLLLIGLLMLLVIPLSVWSSDLIYDTYRQSIDSTLSSAESLTGEAEELTEAESTGAFRSVLNYLSDAKDDITERASKILNNFVETLAVMLVTSCLIPILVLLFFVWLVKQLTGVDLGGYMPRRHRHHHEEHESERQRAGV